MSFNFQCRTYNECIMKTFECTFWIITVCLVLNPLKCSITKRRLCVKYKKENHLVQTSYIKESYAENESKCMASCVRLEGCWVFNYHVTNKTCILMQKVYCMATSSPNSSGYLFVHLQSCMMQPVQFSVRPADLGWHWITVYDASKVNGYIPEMPSDTARFVSRILYRGSFLIGWRSLKGRGSLFRAVDPVTRQMVRCPIGEFLGAVSIRKTVLPGMAIPMLKIRRPNGRLIFNMEITIRS